jgi:hydrogenase maturation protease
LSDCRVKPLLALGFGNLSRGDDGLGLLLLDKLASAIDPDCVDVLSDFQLQIEYALDLRGRRQVWFFDAAVSGEAPFSWRELQAKHDHSYSSHALSPEALLRVYQTVCGAEPPQAFLLSVRGERFGLGEALSDAAEANLQAAWFFLRGQLFLSEAWLKA